MLETCTASYTALSIFIIYSRTRKLRNVSSDDVELRQAPWGSSSSTGQEPGLCHRSPTGNGARRSQAATQTCATDAKAKASSVARQPPTVWHQIARELSYTRHLQAGYDRGVSNGTACHTMSLLLVAQEIKCLVDMSGVGIVFSQLHVGARVLLLLSHRSELSTYSLVSLAGSVDNTNTSGDGAVELF